MKEKKKTANDFHYGAPLTKTAIDTLTCRLLLGDYYDAIELREVLEPLTNSGAPLKKSAGGVVPRFPARPPLILNVLHPVNSRCREFVALVQIR